MQKDKETRVVELEAELEELRQQLFEANELVEAIRTGQIDALVLEGAEGSELFTLKTADFAYRVFIEKMTEGALTLNQEGLILYSNSQFATMVGLELSTVIGTHLQSYIVDAKNSFDVIFEQCSQNDGKLEVLLKGKGNNIPVQISVTSLEIDKNLALSVIVTDLSAQKKTQQQLEESNRRLATMNNALEESNHDLQQFASVASHDLQEPLRKIEMFSNRLTEKYGPDLNLESRRYLEKIVYSSKRMKTLIVDVLNYSRLSATDHDFESVDLDELVKELIEDFDLVTLEKDASITIESLPVIEANKGQMRQMFQNIISNSLKFAIENIPPVIKITSRKVGAKSFDGISDNNGNYCILSIRDNGIGFDEKYLSNIFALFERLHSKDQYEGTGIGLAITKKIVEKHNGLLHAKSAPGQGAEFLILLPVRQ